MQSFTSAPLIICKAMILTVQKFSQSLLTQAGIGWTGWDSARR